VVWPTGGGRTAQAARPSLLGARATDEPGGDLHARVFGASRASRRRGSEGRTAQAARVAAEPVPGRAGAEGRKAQAGRQEAPVSRRTGVRVGRRKSCGEGDGERGRWVRGSQGRRVRRVLQGRPQGRLLRATVGVGSG